MADLVLNAAYVALLASTFTRALVWLRVTLVLASIAFVVYGSIESIESMVLWNLVIGAMHLFRIVRDYRQQRSVALSADEGALRDEFFPDLSDFDFHLLWCIGEAATHTNEVVIAAGSQPNTVSLVLEGTATIRADGLVTRSVRRGGLLGEMSYVSGELAKVDVVAEDPVIVHRWDQRQLAAMEQVHPASARAFRQLLSKDLVAKART